MTASCRRRSTASWGSPTGSFLLLLKAWRELSSLSGWEYPSYWLINRSTEKHSFQVMRGWGVSFNHNIIYLKQHRKRVFRALLRCQDYGVGEELGASQPTLLVWTSLVGRSWFKISLGGEPTSDPKCLLVHRWQSATHGDQSFHTCSLHDAGLQCNTWTTKSDEINELGKYKVCAPSAFYQEQWNLNLSTTWY